MIDDRLTGLENKSVTGDVRQYSRFIKLIKVVLPLGVVAIIGLLLIYPQIAAVDIVPLSQHDLQALKTAQTENKLKNPIYNTLDSKGNPYSITAKMASQSHDNSDLVMLENPTATLSEGKMTYSMRAGSGEYDQAQKILILDNQVTLQDSNNIILKTDRLISIVETGRAYSDSETTLTSPDGMIEGQSVHIDHHNQITTFKGPAKATIIKR